MPVLPAPREIGIRIHDSPLGRWEQATWAPPFLRGIVQVMWYFDGELTHPRERVFPSGRPELIVHLDDVYREVSGTRADRYPRVCITGQMLRPLVIESPGRRTAVLGIRFEPAGACMLLGSRLHELTNATIDLADVLGVDTVELAERCAAAAGARGRLRAAAGWVERRVGHLQHAGHGAGPDPAVRWAADIIEQAQGQVSIAALRQRTGWSRTRFTTTFREQVGVPPKTLARVVRFRQALLLLQGGRMRLSEVALACGYYDQAHFTTEFRDLCGVPPSQYRSAVRYPTSGSLAEPGRP